MKLNKTVVKTVTTILAMGMMSISSMAAAPMPPVVRNETVSPYWAGTFSVQPAISTSDGTVFMELLVEAEDNNEKISGNMYLEKYSSGKWKRVKTWKITGKGVKFLQKSYKGVPDTEYRIRVVVKVGTDQIEEVSDSCVV